MAEVTFDSLDDALEQFIRKEITNQINRSSITSDLIRKEPGIGKNLAWDITVGTAEGQVFDDGQAISTYNADTELLCTLPWAEYGDTFKITGRAEDAAALSNTELGRTWFKKMNEARERGAARLNKDLFSGTGGTSPNTLKGLLITAGGLDSSGTYAGPDRATYSQWQGTKLGNGGVPRALSLNLIEYGFELSFTASGKSPTWGTTTPNIWRRLCELVDDDRRINQDTQIRGEVIGIKLGYNAVEVNGVPVFKDISVPSGNLIFFHDPSVSWEYLPAAAARVQRGKIMATVPLAGMPQEQSMLGAPASGGPLVANVIALPSNGNFEAWMLDATCNFKVVRPNAHIWITDIAYRAE